LRSVGNVLIFGNLEPLVSHELGGFCPPAALFSGLGSRRPPTLGWQLASYASFPWPGYVAHILPRPIVVRQWILSASLWRVRLWSIAEATACSASGGFPVRYCLQNSDACRPRCWWPRSGSRMRSLVPRAACCSARIPRVSFAGCPPLEVWSAAGGDVITGT